MSRIDEFEVFRLTVIQLLGLQKEYFKTRDRTMLTRCKSMEAKVMKMSEDLKPSALPLFEKADQ